MGIGNKLEDAAARVYGALTTGNRAHDLQGDIDSLDTEGREILRWFDE